MKSELLITAMKNSISDVLETMFYLPLEYPDDVDINKLWSTGKDQIIASKLNFNGPLSGCAVIGMPKKLALSITADFMGQDEEEITDNQIDETVKETINMIIGNAFSQYDPEAVFNLDIPELVRFNDYLKDLSDSGQKVSIVMETMEYHLVFIMKIENA